MSANPAINFLIEPLEEVKSLKLLGLTIRHDLSWTNHISEMASKASRRLGILHRARSFLGQSEHLKTYDAFIHVTRRGLWSFMEYCSPLWAGTPASHLAQFDAVETKAFKIIGISHDEAESMGLSLYQRIQVGGLAVFYHLIFGLVPSVLSWLCPSQVSGGCT